MTIPLKLRGMEPLLRKKIRMVKIIKTELCSLRDRNLICHIALEIQFKSLS
jgi:hypothetical protein